jgi:hypothetical protein
MIKLKDILLENDGGEEPLDILHSRRNKKEREKNYNIALQKKIQQYIADGSEGDLDLYSTPIQSLPDNLSVGGSLDLGNTPIQSLPDNLSVGGGLDLRDTPIQTLPDNLSVGGDLDLRYTQIQTLPDNLNVGGDLYIRTTPLAEKYSRQQIKQMCPDVKGNIYD